MIAAAVLVALAGPTAKTCPTARSSATAAGTIVSGIAPHRALRQELGVALPEAPTRVLMYSEGGHLQTTRMSIVAVRDATGRWSTDAVGTSWVWTMNVPPRDMPHLTRVLPAADGHAVDALLRNPAFWREAEHASNNPDPSLRGLMSRRITVLTPYCVHQVHSVGATSLSTQLDRLVSLIPK